MADGFESLSPRPIHRQFVAALTITTCIALMAGVSLKTPDLIGANDISRWCTVWSLLERGTYAIDECPWQAQTQDKVLLPEPFPEPGTEPRKRFYSSKPPFLPTLIAGVLYPFRAASGVALDRQVVQNRVQRLAVESLDYQPKANQKVIETRGGYKIIDITGDPVLWPSYVFYFDPIILLLNVAPFGLMLWLYCRWLDRFAANDWAWMFGLVAAAFGTNLFLFSGTLNNHTVAAWCVFFATWAWFRIMVEGERRPILYVLCGLFAASSACTELPAALFAAIFTVSLLIRHPRQTLLWFVPAAIVPCALFLGTQYIATGRWTPVYAEFKNIEPGSPYYYPGSYWLTPLGADALNESKGVYLFHMLLGHHGILTLTPITLVAFWGLFRVLRAEVGSPFHRLRGLAWITAGLTAAIIGYYSLNTNNYGGSTQGLRWLFWLFPLWILFLPTGAESGQTSTLARRLSLAALALSAFNSGYGLLGPWSHPWLLDFLEHVGLYVLRR